MSNSTANAVIRGDVSLKEQARITTKARIISEPISLREQIASEQFNQHALSNLHHYMNRGSGRRSAYAR